MSDSKIAWLYLLHKKITDDLNRHQSSLLYTYRLNKVDPQTRKQVKRIKQTEVKKIISHEDTIISQ